MRAKKTRRITHASRGAAGVMSLLNAYRGRMARTSSHFSGIEALTALTPKSPHPYQRNEAIEFHCGERMRYQMNVVPHVWRLIKLGTFFILGVSSLRSQDDSNFAVIDYPMGFGIELPDNWVLLKADEIKTAAAAAEAIFGTTTPGKLTILSAQTRKPNAFGYAGTRISVTQQTALTQAQLRDLTDDELAEIGSSTVSDFQAAEGKGGFHFREVKLVRRKLSDYYYGLVTSYIRNSLDDSGDVKVDQIAIPFGTRVITLTISYNIKMGAVWQPICGHIEQSFKLKNTSFWPPGE
jgi:hypothetical protein